MALDASDLKVLSDLQMHCSLAADLVVDMIKKERVQSAALTLGSVHNSLRKAAMDSQNLIDRTKYLEKINGPNA